MGEILNRVRAQLNFDPRAVARRARSRRMLEGGHTSVQVGRSNDFVDLREYVAGDDVRDVDWRASARSGHLVVRRFVAEKSREFLLVADTGANQLATAPSGESKRELAVLALGAIGLVATAQADKIGVVYGDDRGSSVEAGKAGEDHLEQILTLITQAHINVGNPSNIVRQLQFVATHLDRRYAIYIVCDQPEVTSELVEAVMTVRSRNTVHWILIEDVDLLGQPSNSVQEVIDLSTGRGLLTPAALGPRVREAYRRAEMDRTTQWQAFTAQVGSPFVRVSSRTDIGPALDYLAQGGGV